MKGSVVKQGWVLDVQDLRRDHTEVKRAIRELMASRPNGAARFIALCDLEDFQCGDYALSWNWPEVLAAFLKQELPELGDADPVLIYNWW